MLEPGFAIADRWEIVGPLDTGSMSVVYRGRDRSDGHPVAVKVMKSGFAQDPVAIQRQIREARVIHELRHPQVVSVEGSGMLEDGRPFIVMELLEGETLELRLARGRLDPPVAAEVVKQVAAALDAAHAAGVIHRDLKPDNVFLLATADGSVRIKILDFGLAKLAGNLAVQDGYRTESNALLGTPLYMSPEQIRASRDVDFRSDLWSLAVMAYELVVGAAPFDARPVPDLFVEILSRPIPPPSQRAESLAPALDSWAVRALERSPLRRFQSGRQLAEAFSDALQGIPTAPPPPPAPEPAPHAGPGSSRPPGSPIRGVPWMLVAFVAALVMLAVLLAARLAHGMALLASMAGP